MRYLGGAVLVLALLATPAWAVYVTDFNAPTFHDGNLGGQQAWPSSNSSSKIAITDSANNGMVKIMAASDATKSSKVLTNEAGDLMVDIDIYPGYPGAAGPNNIWAMFIRDDNNLDSMWWYGTANNFKVRVLNTVLPSPAGVTFDGRTTLRSIVHISTHTTEYFYDKHDGNGMVSMGTLGGYMGTAGTWFRFENQKRIDGLDEWALFDNLSIVPEPASLLLLALGGLLLRRRQA